MVVVWVVLVATVVSEELKYPMLSVLPAVDMELWVETVVMVVVVAEHAVARVSESTYLDMAAGTWSHFKFSIHTAESEILVLEGRGD